MRVLGGAGGLWGGCRGVGQWFVAILARKFFGYHTVGIHGSIDSDDWGVYGFDIAIKSKLIS